MNDLLDQESPTTPYFKTSFAANETHFPNNHNSLYGTSSLTRTNTSSTSYSKNSNASLTTFSKASNFLKFGKNKGPSSTFSNRASIPVGYDSQATRLYATSSESSIDSSPIQDSGDSFPNVAPLAITKKLPPEPLQLASTTLPKSASEPDQLNHQYSSAAPPVVPYIYKATRTVYTGKSLVGINCCFCEESLESSLTGEKVVILQCGDVAHCECLKQTIDLTLIDPNDSSSGMPFCPTCDDVALPVDNNLYHEIIRERLLQPSFTELNIGYNYNLSTSAPGKYNHYTLAPIPGSPFNETHSYTSLPSATSPPPLTPSGQSSSATDGSPASYFSDRLALSSPPKKSGIHLDKVPGFRLKQTPSNEQHYQQLPTPTLPKGPSVLSKKINSIQNPNTILLKPKAPKISVETEVERVAVSDSFEQYVSCIVNIEVPEDFYSSQDRYRRTSEDLDNSRKITKRLARAVFERTKLDIYSFGVLRIYDTFHVSRDLASWQESTCYMYQSMLLVSRDYKDRNDSDKMGQMVRIKGTVDISRHLKSVSVVSKNGTMLHLSLSSKDLPNLYLSSQNPAVIDTWRSALLDQSLCFPIHRDISSREEFRRLSLVSSKTFSPVTFVSVRPPVDFVLVLPVTGFAVQDSKFPTLRNCANSLLSEMGRFDRMSIILYSTKIGVVSQTGFHTRDWIDWQTDINGIRPSGSSGTNNDLLGALESCNMLITSRDSDRNPITSVLLVNDSSNSEIDAIVVDDIIDNFKNTSVCVHSFGVTINHIPDTLASISSATSGTYFYVREWSALCQCLLSRFRTDQSYTHSRVEIHLKSSSQVSVTSVSGVESVINSDVLKTWEGKPPSLNSTRSFKPTDFKSVKLGNLFAGQISSFMVQVSIPPKSVISTKDDWNKSQEMTMELFTATISYGGFSEDLACSDEGEIEIKQSAVVTLFDGPESSASASFGDVKMIGSSHRFSASSSVYSPSSSGVESHTNSIIINDLPPSPLYGDLLVTFDILRAPMFLSNDKHNILVARRRIQLIAVRTLENVLLQCCTGQCREAHKTLDEARLILRGILEVATASVEDNELSKETTRIVEILDKDLGVISEKVLRPIAFASDVRNWVIQTIGVLRSQTGFTSRSPIESIFYEKNLGKYTEF